MITRTQILEHYKITQNTGETARFFDIHYKRVWKTVHRAGLYKTKHIIIDDVLEKDIIDSFLNGESQISISKRTGVSQTRIGRFLRNKGIITEPIKPAGEKHSCWRGGRHKSYGYWRIWMDRNDPLYCMASTDGYVMEHRIMMARKLGRPLTPTETVHHVDGNRENNNIENLQLRQGRHGRGVVCRCLDCGSYNITQEELGN